MNSIIQIIQEKPILFGAIALIAVLIIGLSIGLAIDIRRNQKVQLKNVEKLPYPLLGTVREIKVGKTKHKKKKIR